MTTVTLATDNATTQQPQPQAPQQPGQGNRITERDPDYLRLRAAAERQLTDSLARLVRELRRAKHDTVRVAAAQSAFIRRHTDLLRQAYAKAHQEGARDYFGAVSHQPSKWARRVQPSGARMEQRLLFYAAGSVTRMANEAALAAHQMHLAQQRRSLAERLTGRVMEALRFADAPEDMLQDWFVGMVGRLQLQSEITWNGLQDGYSDAGAVDPASPYTVLWWDLGPVKTQHCDQCPVYAAGSPYGRPGSGDNELNATPGDGHTDCGAACHCSLRYGSDPDAVRRAVFAWLDAGVEAGWIDPEALRADNEVIPTEAGAAVGVEPGPAYEDLPTDEVHLRSLMIDALDQYRAAVEAYQATIAAQGQSGGGLPDLLSSNTDTLAQMLEALPTLTAEQQRLVVEALDATAQFAVALEQAASLGFDALLWDVGYMRLAESWPRGEVFIDYQHDPKTGRFAPTGAGGVAERGGGHSDSARMVQAMARYREAGARYTRAKSQREAADQARRQARNDAERHQHIEDMNAATREMQAAQEEGRRAMDEYERAKAGLPTRQEEAAPERSAQRRTDQGLVVQPRTIGEPAPRRIGGKAASPQTMPRSQDQESRNPANPNEAAIRPRTIGESATRGEHGTKGRAEPSATRREGGPSANNSRHARQRERKAAEYQVSQHHAAMRKLAARMQTAGSAERMALQRQYRDHEAQVAPHIERLLQMGVSEAEINQLAEDEGATVELVDAMEGGSYDGES